MKKKSGDEISFPRTFSGKWKTGKCREFQESKTRYSPSDLPMLTHTSRCKYHIPLKLHRNYAGYAMENHHTPECTLQTIQGKPSCDHNTWGLCGSGVTKGMRSRKSGRE
ncbi:unnamed protein product [Penicillium roqueforti FM164]|uniref:Genomic scaffold, ProqFM164S02 n=1 Tax=Penicillium roqueforti (strain FM164) TaxID=1365484 RepID=W6Q953_PENRF|nr:unnamed protein product [Penicillium roqueforti FM164]